MAYETGHGNYAKQKRQIMTKKELLATAKTLNIRRRSKMNKAELQRAIEMTLGEPINQPEEATVDSKQMLVSLTQDMNLKFDNGEKVNIVELRAPRDEMDVLFNDPSPSLFEDYGKEAALSEVIELQERMAKGMKLIEDVQRRRQEALDRYLLAKWRFKACMEELKEGQKWLKKLSRIQAVKTLVNGKKAWIQSKKDICVTKVEGDEKIWVTLTDKQCAARAARFPGWKKDLWKKANKLRKERDEAWKEYEGHKEYLKTPQMAEPLSRLWDQWKALKAQCNEIIATTNATWPDYFKFVLPNPNEWTEYDDPNYYLQTVGFDPKDIDNQEKNFDPQETIDCLFDSHLKDDFSKPDTYTHELVEDLPLKSWGYVPQCKDLVKEWAKMNQRVAYIVDQRGRVHFKNMIQVEEQNDLISQWAELDAQFIHLLDEEEFNRYA